MTDQEILTLNVQKWQAAQKLREQKEQAGTLPKFKRLVEYEAGGIKGWMTVPGGASVDGK